MEGKRIICDTLLLALFWCIKPKILTYLLHKLRPLKLNFLSSTLGVQYIKKLSNNFFIIKIKIVAL